MSLATALQPPALRQRRLSFVAIGLVAIAFQLWASLGLMPRGATDAPWFGQICTSAGVVAIAADSAADGAASHGGDHRCCTFCGMSAPLLWHAPASAVAFAGTSAATIAVLAGVLLPAARYATPLAHAPPAI